MKINEIKIKKAIEDGSIIANSKGADIQIPDANMNRPHYLGMSGIGYCPIVQYLEYHKPKPEDTLGFVLNYEKEFTPQNLRIFRLGHLLEEEIVTYLSYGGINVYGSQDTFTDFNNLFKGHCDGKITLDQEYIIEIKGINDDNYRDLEARKVRIKYPVYFCQVQIYLYYSGLQKGYFIAINKNDSTVYVEEIIKDNNVIFYLREKAYNILFSKHVRDVKCNREEQSCTFCSYSEMCDVMLGKKDES